MKNLLRKSRLLLCVSVASCLQICWATPDWGKGKWDAADGALIAVEKQVSSELWSADKTRALAIVEKYRSIAEVKSTDALAQYRYAFALYQYTGKVSKFFKPDTFSFVSRALEQNAKPRSYRYTRMTFLVHAMTGLHMRELYEVGRRLAKRNPNDYDVLFRLPGTVDYKKADQRFVALQAAHKARSMRPKYSGTLHLLANTYGSAWIATNDRSYGNKAIAYYGSLSKDSNVPASTRKEYVELVEYIKKR